MSGVWYLGLAALAVVALGLIVERVYREIFTFEGIRLGERVHVALYDGGPTRMTPARGNPEELTRGRWSAL